MGKFELKVQTIFGDNKLDQQHRRFVSAAGEIAEAIQAGGEPNQLVHLLSKLREFAVYHFNDEEAFLRSVDYPETTTHCLEHEELRKQARLQQNKIFKTKTTDEKALREYLKKLLVDHVIHSDLKVRRFLEDKKPAQADDPVK